MKKNAFTLLELSIVIVVIGLIAGGVLVGDSLMKGAKMRAVAAEQARFTTAVKMFKEKYYALPGDFSGAAAMWGTASGGCPWGARSGSETCSGDGSGKVTTAADAREYYTFWQHLGISGMLEQTYSGLNTMVVGTNVPKSEWSQAAGWSIEFVPTQAADGAYYAGNYGHVLMLRTFTDNNGAMSPEEQHLLDNKYDDGMPASGNIRGIRTTLVTGCITGTTYDTSTGNNNCAPLWIAGF